jgi:hypothetical protein
MLERFTGDIYGQAATVGVAALFLVIAFLCWGADLIGEARRKGKRLLSWLHLLNVIGNASFGASILVTLVLLWTQQNEAANVSLIVVGVIAALLLTGHVVYFICVGVAKLVDWLVGDPLF